MRLNLSKQKNNQAMPIAGFSNKSCPNCKSINYESKSGETVSCLCKDCGHNWVVGGLPQFVAMSANERSEYFHELILQEQESRVRVGIDSYMNAHEYNRIEETINQNKERELSRIFGDY